MRATMAVDVKDLCRLCAKKEHDLKDLNDENNKNILKMVQELIQIAISENDTLPTKICLNCEEKMVSFQLFVLECYNVQETLQSMCLKECDKYSLKFETSSIHFGVSDIKSEVKEELDDVEVSLETEKTFLDYDGDYENDEDFKCDSDSDDGLTLASLKEAKLNDMVKKTVKHRKITDEERQEFERLLHMTKFKLKDFVKMKCEICSKSFKTWNGLQLHYANTHSSKAVTFCICGFAIKSKNAVYRHVAGHRSERRKIQKSCEGYDLALKVTDFVKFNCEECKEEFSSWYKLNSHCTWKHKVTPIVHCKCGIPLNSRTAMYKHIQDHRAPNVLHCNECPKIAKTVEELEKHKMRHIPKSERTFQCSSCDKQFSSKDCLKSHERSHIPIEQRKIYDCDVCNEKFTTRSSAVSHKRIVHDKIKSYVCDLCGYACGTNGELRQHRAIHSEDKPYVCRKCSKTFKTYSNLKTHMDTHEETSYVCFVCSRVLNSRRTLRKHLLVHEDKCSHVCNYCNKAFKRRQTLKVHLAMHTGDKPLSCRWCDERFAYASTLRSHRLRAHPDKIPAHFAGNYNAQAQQVPQNYLKNEAASLNNTTKCDVQQLNN